MKKLKKFLLAFAGVVLLFSALPNEASAQISEGNPTTTVIRTGNRPDAGTWGVYMGVTSNIFKACFDGFNVTAMPLINFKYMATDNLEWRLGLELMRTGKALDGSTDVSNDFIKYSQRDVTNGRVLFYPGLAYHFSTKNIFDVYVGGELPIGFLYEGNTLAQNGVSNVYSQCKFNLGLGAFVGFQVFIANLPLALGLEYGLSFNALIGDKYKTTQNDGHGNKSVAYGSDMVPGATFSKLSASRSELGNQLRLTLSYYFK